MRVYLPRALKLFVLRVIFFSIKCNLGIEALQGTLWHCVSRAQCKAKQRKAHGLTCLILRLNGRRHMKTTVETGLDRITSLTNQPYLVHGIWGLRRVSGANAAALWMKNTQNHWYVSQVFERAKLLRYAERFQRLVLQTQHQPAHTHRLRRQKTRGDCLQT